MKKIKEAVRAWKLNRKTFACLLDISNEVDTQISGWMNYYMKFGRSEFRKVLNYINDRLTRWVMRKYKLFHILLQPQIEELIIYHVGIILLSDEILLQQSFQCGIH